MVKATRRTIIRLERKQENRKNGPSVVPGNGLSGPRRQCSTQPRALIYGSIKDTRRPVEWAIALISQSSQDGSD
ncbi:hypothetical protein BDZ89DRAFT_1079526, partial [Hymenopellis radicata]